MSSRLEAYKAIDSERLYQDQFYSPENKLSHGDYLALLQTYLNRAYNEWQPINGESKVLHSFRKIAAIAVKAMEEHGAVSR